MTPILFLAWYFPPIGGAGVQRSLKFARFLPDHGIRPTMLTGPAQLDSRWAPDDQSLLREVPDDLVVIRPDGAPTPSRLQRLQHRLTGESTALTRYWRDFALDRGTAAAKEHGARAILCTLGPFECLDGALALGERTGLPVVADLRDPWALDEMRSYGHAMQQRCDRRRMRTQLSRCALVVMNTPRAAEMMREFLRPAPPLGFDHVTNGYDREDFAGPPPAPVDDGRFRIVHTGYLHTDSARLGEQRSPLRRALGGHREDVDLWGRTHRYLLQAIARLGAESPELVGRLEVHLHGVLSPSDEAEIASSPHRDIVRTFGYRPHDEVVEAMRRADLLFLPMQGLPRGTCASIVPGKTYEYLAAGRPILAAVPEGDARDFVRAAGAGVTVDPADVAGMTRALRDHVSAGRAPDRPLTPAVECFERRELTRKLAGILQRVL